MTFRSEERYKKNVKLYSLVDVPLTTFKYLTGYKGKLKINSKSTTTKLPVAAGKKKVNTYPLSNLA